MTIARKLADIGEMLGTDGTAYITIRMNLEYLETLSNNTAADKILEIVDHFYRLMILLKE